MSNIIDIDYILKLRKKEKRGLQFTEKYRPERLIDIISHQYIKDILEIYNEKKDFPDVIFYGKAGIGKTSLIKSLLCEIYKIDINNINPNILYINAALNRSIENIKTNVYSFINTLTINNDLIKIVVFDEADNLTIDSQNIIKDFIGKKNIKFCFICNYEKNIIPEIKSRCLYLKFFSLLEDDIKKKIKKICLYEDINISNNGLNKLIKSTNSDIRKLLNILQILKINFKDKPIYEKDIDHYMNLIPSYDFQNLIILLENKNLSIDDKINIFNNKYKCFDFYNIIEELHTYFINNLDNDINIINKLNDLSNLELYYFNEFNLNNLIIFLINIFN